MVTVVSSDAVECARAPPLMEVADDREKADTITCMKLWGLSAKDKAAQEYAYI